MRGAPEIHIELELQRIKYYAAKAAQATDVFEGQQRLWRAGGRVGALRCRAWLWRKYLSCLCGWRAHDMM